ncbi:MAG: DUF3570 domain-containing protein [Magnetococcales bacterium]|nr:DUF3570 domain-containing protein [Magnetococcales bacterium]
MVVTKNKPENNCLASLMVAAIVLPGVVSEVSAAAPQEQEVGVELLYYHEHGDGIDVVSPVIYGQFSPTPKSNVEISAVFDSVSGASIWLSSDRTGKTAVDTTSGASTSSTSDTRKALDLKYSHYLDDLTWALGAGFSREDDYESKSVSMELKKSFNKQNTELSLSIGYGADEILIPNSSSDDDSDSDDDDDDDDDDGDSQEESKNTFSMLVGVTQLLSPVSLVQSNISFTNGSGYFADPYQQSLNPATDQTIDDTRPSSRQQWAWLTRYNHFFPKWESSLHLDYRYYIDSWDISSHTLAISWYQPLPNDWTLRPSLRYYNQSAASFFAETLPSTMVSGDFSMDQRLSSFGAISLGAKVVKKLSDNTRLTARIENYRQSPDFTWSSGSNVDDWQATILALGLRYTF